MAARIEDGGVACDAVVALHACGAASDLAIEQVLLTLTLTLTLTLSLSLTLTLALTRTSPSSRRWRHITTSMFPSYHP